MLKNVLSDRKYAIFCLQKPSLQHDFYLIGTLIQISATATLLKQNTFVN
jgi:hypothetical protein